MGWSGDAQVFAPTACYLHESHAFLVKWLRDLMADHLENATLKMIPAKDICDQMAKDVDAILKHVTN